MPRWTRWCNAFVISCLLIGTAPAFAQPTSGGVPPNFGIVDSVDPAKGTIVIKTPVFKTVAETYMTTVKIMVDGKVVEKAVPQMRTKTVSTFQNRIWSADTDIALDSKGQPYGQDQALRDLKSGDAVLFVVGEQLDPVYLAAVKPKVVVLMLAAPKPVAPPPGAVPVPAGTAPTPGPRPAVPSPLPPPAPAALPPVGPAAPSSAATAANVLKLGKIDLNAGTIGVEVTQMVPETRAVTVPVKKLVDGKEVTVNETKNVTVYRSVVVQTMMKLSEDTVVLTGDGTEIKGAARFKALKDGMSVLSVTGAQVHPMWFKLLKPDAVILWLKQSST